MTVTAPQAVMTEGRTGAPEGKEARTPQIIGRHLLCGAEWASRSHAHCSGCCRHFTSPAGFDRHRRGTVCLDPSTIRTFNGKGSPVFKQVRRKHCTVPVWTLNNDKDEEE